MKRIKFILIATVIMYSSILAQSTRSLVNDGVDAYEKSKYADAEVNFKKGAENDAKSYESKFNLGDATYKQGRFDEAVKDFKNSYPLAKTNLQKAEILHNIGNSLLKAKKLKESIGAYREALKLNPNDMDTKYNLSYAIKQMQNQNKNNKNKNDQNKDKNKNQQNKDQNKDKQDQNKNKQDQQKQNQQQQQQKNQQNQQQKPEPKDEISKAEAQRILDALKNNEAELQKKMREHKSKKTNVEKDW